MPTTAPLARLIEWLNQSAYPIWWEKGADRVHGGFHEKLGQDGAPVALPKRARVLPRQIYAFAQAKALGWSGDAAQAVKFGLEFYLDHFLRPDGLARALVAPDGAPLDDKAAFYDQAFALLGLHSAFITLGDGALVDRARLLLRRWCEDCRHPLIGFEESVPRTLPLGANPHMHLLESCLAWAESDSVGPWRAIADEIAELALTRFIDAGSGALREFFAGDWMPMPGEQGRIVEPGHQFEWGWLLMRWGRLNGSDRAVQAGLRLVEIGETHGVDRVRNVACNTLRDDFSHLDWRARLWPQTERIKAHCLAAEVTGESAHWDLAALAAEGLMLYLATPIDGLWFDMLSEKDGMVNEPAPASSFYHIVCAIREFRRAAAG